MQEVTMPYAVAFTDTKDRLHVVVLHAFDIDDARKTVSDDYQVKTFHQVTGLGSLAPGFIRPVYEQK